MYLKDLSRIDDCKDIIQGELERCGINVIHVHPIVGPEDGYPVYGEVDTTHGKLVFKRYWEYYSVEDLAAIPNDFGLYTELCNIEDVKVSSDSYTIYSESGLKNFVECLVKERNK